MGRERRKLTPELQDQVCEGLKYGVDVETACRRVGIHPSTYYDWRDKGRKGEEPYASFYEATETAMADLEAKVTATILKACTKNWQAGAWWLRFRKTGGKQQVELSGPNGAPITGTLTPEAADKIREKILFGERGAAEEPAEEPHEAEP